MVMWTHTNIKWCSHSDLGYRQLERAQAHPHAKRKSQRDSKLKQMIEAKTLTKDTSQSRDTGKDGDRLSSPCT